jgi:DNA-binding CsgD family transcriptional regulator
MPWYFPIPAGNNSSKQRKGGAAMGRSNRLRLEDVRAAFRLIGGCRDLGGDTEAWRRHALQGLGPLLGARVTNVGEIHWPRHDGLIRYLHPVVVGFSAEELDILAPVLRKGEANSDPIFAALSGLTGRPVTRTRRQLVDDRAWYRSIAFNEYRRVVGVDQCIDSLYPLGQDGMFSFIDLHRGLGERAFSSRERSLLHLFHEELGRLIGTVLARPDGMGRAGLSPRLRQTLGCLLEGDSEKQVAARLGLSRPTVHQYVMALYRHFVVSSRAELLAHFLRRSRRAGGSLDPDGVRP